MKNTIATILSGLVLAASSSVCDADVLIYKNRITSAETGVGAITRQAVTGWTVVDPQTADVVRINASARRGRFTTVTPSWTFIQVSGGIGKNYTVASDAYTDFFDDDSQYLLSTVLKGVNVELDTFTTEIYTAPKVLSFVEREITSLLSGEQLITESSGKLTFDKINTQDANLFGLTLEETVNALKDLLLQKGYLEE